MSIRFYRPELDVIRFVAFFTVFLYHGLPNHTNNAILDSAAASCGFGLCLFFTLSAYLITTLLLKEREKTGSIDLLRFYKRRILRIWPLYLAALLVSAAVAFLHHTLRENAVWYAAALVMLGNVVTSRTTSVVHLWSISVEEQFYVFWPTLMRFLTPRRLLVAALALLFISNSVLAWFGIIHADVWKRVWWNSFAQLEFFAAGILLALRDEYAPPAKRSWVVRLAGLLCIPVLWFSAVYFFHIQGGDHVARGPFSLCIGFALVAIACTGLIDLLRGLDHWPKQLIYLGKVSYGLYVFHVTALGALHHIPILLVRLPLALALTITAAFISYTWFESPFLRLKERYEVVLSRPVF
ncbi:MAG: acyltransferase [Terracidiphilus sp.]